MGLGLLSVLLAFAALMGAVLGFVMTAVPYVGAALSLAAPLLAVAAVVTGAVAMRRARQVGDSTALGLTGVVSGVLVFCPSVLVALTCGMCNAVFTSQPDAWRQQGWAALDGGGPAWAAPPGDDAPSPASPPEPPPPGDWAEPEPPHEPPAPPSAQPDAPDPASAPAEPPAPSPEDEPPPR